MSDQGMTRAQQGDPPVREPKSRKHSSYPWIVSRDGDTILAPGDRRIAEVYTQGKEPSYEESSNAHLIAAAPELLEALKDMLRIFEEYAEDWDKGSVGLAIIKDAKEAIRKAEGK